MKIRLTKNYGTSGGYALHALPFILTLALFNAGSLWAASGTWNGSQNAEWTNDANWSGSSYPSGGETATFDNAGNGNISISVAGLSSLLNMTFTGSSVESYTIGSPGQKITLLAGSEILLAADAANSQNIMADLEMPTGTSPFTFRNDNPERTLTLERIHGYTVGGVNKSMYFDGSGPIVVNDLDNMASDVYIYHRTTSTVDLAGD
ncbi:MAG: hypothetical protein R6V06_07970 [Kiritimatiellia bacterium]